MSQEENEENQKKIADAGPNSQIPPRAAWPYAREPPNLELLIVDEEV